jgi:AraC-like DNA-binding protein
MANQEEFPLSVQNIGVTVHKRTIRPEGYSALQIFFCRSGKGVFRFFGLGECPIEPNQWVIVPQKVPHEYYSVLPPDELWLLGYFSLYGHQLDELLRHFQLPYLKVISMNEPANAWELVEHLWQQAAGDDAHFHWEAAKDVYLILAELRKQLVSPSGSPSDNKTARSDIAVEQAVNIINEHFNEPLLMSLLAKTAGFSHQHLNRLFKKKMDVTLYQYLQRIRMRKCLVFLQNRQLTIREIAEQIGMDTGNFIRLFSRHYGMPPAQWRDRNRLPV